VKRKNEEVQTVRGKLDWQWIHVCIFMMFIEIREERNYSFCGGAMRPRITNLGSFDLGY